MESIIYKGNKKIVKVLYIYILLTALPLLLENYPIFTFISQGSNLYSVYIYFLFLLLPLLLYLSNGKYIVVSNKMFLIMYLIIFICFSSFFSDINNSFSTSLFIKTVLLSIGIYIFLGIQKSFQLTEIELVSFMRKLLLFVVFTCLYNLIVNMDLLLFGVSNLQKDQFASFFNNRNTFGMVLTIGIISNTFLFFRKKKVMYLFSFILILWCLILTGSTNALFATIIFMLIFLMLFYRKNPVIKILLLFMIIISFSILYIRGFFEGIFSFIQYNDVSEFNGRLDIWMVGLNSFSENFLFGVGIGKTENILFINGFEVTQFHNEFIEILVSGGIVLFTVYLMLVMYFVIKLFQLYKVKRLVGSLYLAALLSLLFSLFFESHGFFGVGFISGIISIFYLFVPLILINNYLDNGKNVIVRNK